MLYTRELYSHVIMQRDVGRKCNVGCTEICGVSLTKIHREKIVDVATRNLGKCVIIARDRLTLDTAPLVPFINGLLPVPPPVSFNLSIVHVRYDALTPPPLRPAPPTAHLPPVPICLLLH
jgi:hypothetical protein